MTLHNIHWMPHPHDEENGAEYNVGYKGPNQTSINIHDIHLTLMVNNIYLSFDDIYKHLPFVERHLINVDDTIFIIYPFAERLLPVFNTIYANVE